MAQKEQDVAGALIADCLRDELEDRQAEERVSPSAQTTASHKSKAARLHEVLPSVL